MPIGPNTLTLLIGLVSCSRPFPFYYVKERVWPTAIELPVLAFTLGRVSVNWFEVSGHALTSGL